MKVNFYENNGKDYIFIEKTKKKILKKLLSCFEYPVK